MTSTSVTEPNSKKLAIVQQALYDRRFGTLEDVVHQCVGLYLADIVSALEHLSECGEAVPSLEPAPSEGRGVEMQDWPLALPHPLDFDWRFANVTTLALFDRVCESTLPSDTIVACAVPSIYAHALNDPRERIVHLHDVNASRHGLAANPSGTTPESLDFAKDVPPDLGAAYVIADPPWYPQHAHLCLWWVSKIVRPGATIAFALAPRNTRPSVTRERRDLWGLARSYGLDLVNIEVGVLNYQTPPFESEALSAQGVPVLDSWRRGDLALLKASEVGHGEPRPVVEGSAWASCRIGSVDIRFRMDATVSHGDPRLVRIVDGDILDSVSSRDPRRGEAAVWTSLNKVFACRDAPLALQIVGAIGQGIDPFIVAADYLGRDPCEAEAVYIEQSAHQLRSLMDAERLALERNYIAYA